MFTGIVTDQGRVVSVSDGDTLRRIRIACRYDPATIDIGASIACGGPCLTVVAVEALGGNGAVFSVDTARETLERTTASLWNEGTIVNLERALKIGDELGGHIVTGHVDGVATIVGKEQVTASDGPWGASTRFTLRAPRELARFIAPKGSICLDGTSLTINEVGGDLFSVLIIPHTLSVTTWGTREVGDPVNLEVDMMARYAARLAEAQASGY